jgi:hypothetical protein
MKPTFFKISSGTLLALATIAAFLQTLVAADNPSDKPVLLYSRYFNAAGENRYEPDGAYQGVLTRLREHFIVRWHREPLNAHTLAGVKVVLIANPSDQAVPGHPAPPHCSAADIRTLTHFVAQGGGLILMGNQENHNLEIADMNQLLARFGLQWTNLYTDAKQLVLPKDTPLLGGLRWAYYTGNSITVQAGHPARPRALVNNDLAQKPVKGPRDQPGCLLATAEPGAGRVVLVTDSGWINDDALAARGIGGVAITDHDNFEIFLRLARWAARAGPAAK